MEVNAASINHGRNHIRDNFFAVGNHFDVVYGSTLISLIPSPYSTRVTNINEFESFNRHCNDRMLVVS
jgi:hypothetical protein